MSQALDIRAFSAIRSSPKIDFASSAPPVVVAKRAGALRDEALAASGLKLDALDVSALDLPSTRARRPFGLGAAASFLLHMALVLGALLWSQSQVERAPEPIAVDIVVERAPDPATPATTAAEAPPPAPTPEPVEPPVAEAPPPPALTPEPAPSPVAEAPSPPPTPAPIPSPVPEARPIPSSTPEPAPPPVAETTTPTSEPVAEAPPPPAVKPFAKIEPPKPTPPAAPKKAERAPTPAKPKPTPRPAVSRDAAAASPSSARAAAPASSASVGEYRDAVYARIKARQLFPEAAREAGEHGTAELSFILDDAGQVKSVVVVKSSGEAALDADALATVRRAAPFGPLPPGARRDFGVRLRYGLQ